MKHCEEYAPLLNAFADGEVTEQERQEVLCHLDSCQGCRGYLADLMAIKAELATPVPELPENFARQVMWRVGSEKRKKAKRSRRVMTVVASAAACLVLVMALPYVLESGVADDCAAESAVMEDSIMEESTADDALLDESWVDGGTFDTLNDGEMAAASKTESDGLVISHEQMEAWLAENDGMTLAWTEAEEETLYYLDYAQYESLRAFMAEQGVFLGEMGENETMTVYVR